MGCEGLIDDSRVLTACSMNPETAVTFTRGHFNKVVFAVKADSTTSSKLEVFIEDTPRAALWYNCGTKWP